MSDMDMAIEAIPICVPACPWRIRVLGMSDMDMATLACGCFIDGNGTIILMLVTDVDVPEDEQNRKSRILGSSR